MAEVSVSGQDAAAVIEANAAYYTAFEEADIDGMDALWLDGDAGRDVLCVHPGWPPLRGRARVMRSWSMIMANTPYIQFVITDVEVDVLGDVAVLSCSENVIIGTDDPGGATLGFASGRVVATNVFRRTAGRWQLWAHHSSPVIAAEGGADASDADLHHEVGREGSVDDGPIGD